MFKIWCEKHKTLLVYFQNELVKKKNPVALSGSFNVEYITKHGKTRGSEIDSMFVYMTKQFELCFSLVTGQWLVWGPD
jgi:hypothetical protein